MASHVVASLLGTDPLSLRIYCGGPCQSSSFCMIPRTVCALIWRSTWITRHSRVYSSSTGSIFRLPRRSVLSWIKSQVQTWPGCSAFVCSPVETPLRRRLGLRRGIARPSSRRRRCTHRTLAPSHKSLCHLPLVPRALPFFYEGLLHNLYPQHLVRQHPF